MGKLKVAIIVDNLSLATWQSAALEEANSLIDIKLILNCKNTRTKKRIFKNFFYYLLNIFTLQNRLTKKIALDSAAKVDVLSFDSTYKGIWQSIPSEVLLNPKMNNIDLIIKFGMSLLTIDDNFKRVPVFSYHHGDPSRFRGRPAGFYEILKGENQCGVIIQNLTNRLDAGEIYAYAEAKVVHYSYKNTILNFYSISPFLLKKAIANLIDNKPIKRSKEGENYFLPSNILVIKFLIKLLTSLVNKFLYGLFYEKRWKVAILGGELNFESDNLLESKLFSTFQVASKYNFYADPFFSINYKKIRLEALDNSTGLGDIIEFEVNSPNDLKVIFSGCHYSYPYSFEKDNCEIIMPEVASHSNQFCYKMSNEQILTDKFYLNGLEDVRILDGTLFQYANNWYLFFGENTNSHTVLHLWYASTLESKFTRHPKSPVNISPSSARMGGRIVFDKNGIYRFGQNNSKGYGESITISKISCLSPEDYEEHVSGKVYIDNKKGPHTIDLDSVNERVLLDYYEESFSIFAGVRRLRAKFSQQ